MPKDDANRIGVRIDEFGRRYRLWFVIPLLIAVTLAFWNHNAAIGFVIFMLCVWIFVGAIGLILWATRNVLPQSFSDEHKAEFRGALLRNSSEGRSIPFPGQIYPARCVRGVPRAVKRFRMAALI